MWSWNTPSCDRIMLISIISLLHILSSLVMSIILYCVLCTVIVICTQCFRSQRGFHRNIKKMKLVTRWTSVLLPLPLDNCSWWCWARPCDGRLAEAAHPERSDAVRKLLGRQHPPVHLTQRGKVASKLCNQRRQSGRCCRRPPCAVYD